MKEISSAWVINDHLETITSEKIRSKHTFVQLSCVYSGRHAFIDQLERSTSVTNQSKCSSVQLWWMTCRKHTALEHLSKITKKEIIGTTIQSHYCRWLPPSIPLSNIYRESQPKSTIWKKFLLIYSRCLLENVLVSVICRRAEENRMMRKSNRFNTRRGLQRCVADWKISREWQEWWTVISIVLLEYWGWLQANVPGWNLHGQWRAKRII